MHSKPHPEIVMPTPAKKERKRKKKKKQKKEDLVEEENSEADAPEEALN